MVSPGDLVYIPWGSGVRPCIALGPTGVHTSMNKEIWELFDFGTGRILRWHAPICVIQGLHQTQDDDGDNPSSRCVVPCHMGDCPQ